jgi:phosphatidylglycerol:prolipoprotein diacylglycerol transferase
MHPVIYQFGPLTVRGYGFMLVVSFVVGLLLMRARARRSGLDPRHILRLFVVILVAAVVGSRGLHVVENAAVYAGDPARALRFWEGGLSMLGGVLLAIAASALYARAIGRSFLWIADLCAPSIALGEALTRIGCFLNGCCFGTPCDLPWAVVFPPVGRAGQVFPDTAIHPTQLYSSVYSLVVLGILLTVEWRKPRQPGVLIGSYLLFLAIGRFSLEFLRYSEPARHIAVGNLSLTSGQLISLVVFALGVLLLLASGKLAGRTRLGSATTFDKEART